MVLYAQIVNLIFLVGSFIAIIGFIRQKNIIYTLATMAFCGSMAIVAVNFTALAYRCL